MDKFNNINFKAIPIDNINVKKFDKQTGKFVTFPTTFVKLDHNNRNDIKVVETATKYWEGAIYMKKIATATHWMDVVPIDVYALTTQNKCFNKLKYNNILGFAEMRPDANDNRFTSLEHLQVKPEATNVLNPNKKYKKVGTSIIKSLKKIYTNISLFSKQNPNIEKFYKNNNFIRDYNCNTRFLWSANPLMTLTIIWENFRKFLHI